MANAIRLSLADSYKPSPKKINAERFPGQEETEDLRLSAQQGRVQRVPQLLSGCPSFLGG